MIFVWDFHLLNLSKLLGELGQEIERIFYRLAKFTKDLRQVQRVKVINKVQGSSADPQLIHISWLYTVNIYI